VRILKLIIDVEGETIERVEGDIVESAGYVQSAKDDTKTAVKYQSKARRVSLFVHFLSSLGL